MLIRHHLNDIRHLPNNLYLYHCLSSQPPTPILILLPNHVSDFLREFPGDISMAKSKSCLFLSSVATFVVLMRAYPGRMEVFLWLPYPDYHFSDNPPKQVILPTFHPSQSRKEGVLPPKGFCHRSVSHYSSPRMLPLIGTLLFLFSKILLYQHFSSWLYTYSSLGCVHSEEKLDTVNYANSFVGEVRDWGGLGEVATNVTNDI